MQIGELANATGVSERMLRYYEQEGLLRPTRTEAGYRLYGEPELLAARRIRLLSASGLKIESIRLLLPCMVGSGDADDPATGTTFQPCDDVREVLRREIDKLDAKLRDLGESRQIVASFLSGIEAAQ
ncbi:MerR family transcriptional regulator [Pandoraea pnomenusa]|uniref:MerR family transcriptional regulator n=1 Tax=Pandoraea pnomenusa TaxID=93220 RepID=UPI00333E6164